MVDTADSGTCMSAERKTVDGVPTAQAGATLSPRSTLIRIFARFGLLGILVLLGISVAFISATFLQLSNGARYRHGWLSVLA
jgi:hypothetical protein